jgi:putative restriction endonuclease
MKEEIYHWYKNIRQHLSGERYSPHKPLTIIYALTKLLKGERWIEYNKDREELEYFISRYTNFKSKPNCLNPLWRLSKDNSGNAIWISNPSNLTEDKSSNVLASEARETNFKAGFSDDAYSYLSMNRAVAQKLVEHIIDDNFPPTLMEDILDDLSFGDIIPSFSDIEKDTLLKRDPDFPHRIRSLYDFKCSFCGFKIYYHRNPLPPEAAHIKWKARGGECIENNGLSLCPTHHYTFDKGLWSLNDNLEIIMSDNVIIDQSNDYFFTPFLGKEITRFLLNKKYAPSELNIDWHRKNIFK